MAIKDKPLARKRRIRSRLDSPGIVIVADNFGPLGLKPALGGPEPVVIGSPDPIIFSIKLYFVSAAKILFIKSVCKRGVGPVCRTGPLLTPINTRSRPADGTYFQYP